MRIPARHLVTALLVATALAVGLLLGAGPLAGEPDPPPRAAPAGGADARTDTGAGSDAGSDPGTEAATEARMGDELGRVAAPELLRGTLRGQRISILTLPGAETADVNALVRHVELAGATLGAQVGLEKQLFDTSRATYVDELGRRLARRVGSRADAAASTYDRAGQVLGAAVSSGKQDPKPRSRRANGALAGLEQGGLATRTEAGRGLATMVLVVTGDREVADGGWDPTVLRGLTTGLRRAAGRVVVASPDAAGADEGHPMVVLRDHLPRRIGTVDGIEYRAGRIAATLTLVRQITQRGGDFGASGIDGIAPLG